MDVDPRALSTSQPAEKTDQAEDDNDAVIRQLMIELADNNNMRSKTNQHTGDYEKGCRDTSNQSGEDTIMLESPGNANAKIQDTENTRLTYYEADENTTMRDSPKSDVRADKQGMADIRDNRWQTSDTEEMEHVYHKTTGSEASPELSYPGLDKNSPAVHHESPVDSNHNSQKSPEIPEDMIYGTDCDGVKFTEVDLNYLTEDEIGLVIRGLQFLDTVQKQD